MTLKRGRYLALEERRRLFGVLEERDFVLLVLEGVCFRMESRERLCSDADLDRVERLEGVD